MATPCGPWPRAGTQCTLKPEQDSGALPHARQGPSFGETPHDVHDSTRRARAVSRVRDRMPFHSRSRANDRRIDRARDVQRYRREWCHGLRRGWPSDAQPRRRFVPTHPGGRTSSGARAPDRVRDGGRLRDDHRWWHGDAGLQSPAVRRHPRGGVHVGHPRRAANGDRCTRADRRAVRCRDQADRPHRDGADDPGHRAKLQLPAHVDR